MALTSGTRLGPYEIISALAKVFDTKYAAPSNVHSYDVSPDGQRFLMIKELTDGKATASSFVVVLNWVGELKPRVPAK